MDDRVRVLHVDDEPDFAEMVTTYLERVNDRIEATTAHSASDGWEVLASTDVDCIVSDYDMPGKNGLAFLERVRNEYGDLPFILFTGKGSEEIASEAISAGVTDYLQKGGGADQYTVLANRITNAVGRRRVEYELAFERRRFTKLIEHSADVIVILDSHMRFRFVSASAEPILGHVPGDLLGEDALSYVHPEDHHVAHEALSAVVEHPESPVSDEIRLRNADGSWTWIEARARNRLEDPDIGGIVIYSREITDRKARVVELRETERRFRAIFEKSFDAMLIADDEGRYVEVNQAACDLFGLDRDELLGSHITEFAPEGYDFEASWREFRASDRDRDTFPLVRANGARVMIEYAATADILPGEHLSILRELPVDRRPDLERPEEPLDS